MISNLPNLRYLNSVEIDRDELQQESSPSEPAIKEAADDHDHPSFEKIHEVEEEHEGSQRNITKEESKRHLELSSHHSSSANGTQSEILYQTDTEEVCLRPEDLENVALIFDKIRKLHRKHKLTNDKQMASDFDKHLKSCMQNLSETIMTNKISLNGRNSAILRTKYELGQI